MKKLLKLMCLCTIVALITSMCAFAYTKDEAEQRKRLAEEYILSMQQQAQQLNDENFSLMSVTEIPETLLELDGEYVWSENEPSIEIKFAEYGVGNSYSICVQSKETGEIVQDYVSASYQLIRDSDHNTTGIILKNMYTYYLKMGEYNVYVKDNKGNFYEPITFLSKGYSLNQNVFNNRDGETNIYFSLRSMDKHCQYPWLETFSLKFVSEDGAKTFSVNEIRPSYVSEQAAYTYITFPSDISDGKYTLYPTFNMSDGSKIELMTTDIYIGNYVNVSSFGVDNNSLSVYTEKLSVRAYITGMIDASDSFEVVVKDKDGVEVARQSECKFNNINPSSSTMHFIVDVKGKITKQTYTVELVYNGDRTLHQNSSVKYTLTASDKYTVNNYSRLSPSEYTCYIDGMAEGSYNVYKEDRTSSPYKKGELLGTMTVDKDYKALLQIQGNLTNNSGNVYVCPANDETTEYNFYMYIPAYNQRYMPTIPGVSTVMPAYVTDGATSIKAMQIYVDYETYLHRNNIDYIQLVYNGNVIAQGKNIAMNRSNYQSYYNGYKSVFYNKNIFYVDFDIPAAANLVAGDNVTVRVSAEGKIVEKTLPVLNSDSGTVKASISNNNIVSRYSGMVYEKDYDYVQACELSSYKDLYFTINNTNATSGNATLYRYDPETSEFEEKMSIDISGITPKKAYGYANCYPICIRNVEPGYIYYLAFGSSISNYVYVSDTPLIEVPYNCYLDVTDDDVYYWMEYSGMDIDNSTMSVYYIDGNGSKVVLPSEFWVDDSSEVSVDIDFSNVPEFWYKDVYFECNGNVVAKIPAFDMRNKRPTIYSGCNGDNGGQYLSINGNSLEKIKNPVVHIMKKDSFRYTDFEGELVAQYPVSFEGKTYIEIDMGFMDIEPGSYYAYVCSDGVPVSSMSNCFIYTGDNTATEKTPISIKNIKVNGSAATVSFANRSENIYTGAKIILAAYDEYDNLIKVTIKEKNIDSYGSRNYSMDTVAGAAKYKAFVWDGKNAKPLMK